MHHKASSKHRDGRLGLCLTKANRNARNMKPSELHSDKGDPRPADGLVQGILEPKVRDVKAYEDDLFWNEQMSLRVTRMEEEHEKSKRIIVLDRRVKPEYATAEDQARWYELSQRLPIPRRPKWNHTMSPKEVQDKEKEDFLNWRRAMAKIEEDEQVFLTPFEKNLEIWRQLWRVVERSDIVFSLLDARNPLMFRTQDLEEYVRSHLDVAGRPKQVVLLLNKADLLTRPQRLAWAKFFQRNGLRFIFFSAGLALQEAEKEKQRLKKLEALEEAMALGDVTEEEAVTLRATLQPRPESELVKLDAAGHPVDPTHIFGRRDLVHYCHMYATYLGYDGCVQDEAPAPARKPGAPKGFTPKGIVIPKKTGIVVGMVGYPNVGKSSTINALFTTKRVVVSATPGKTKHFQTLILDDVVTLCDCPGLVFPSFVSTREGMICDGILPIATMRDYTAPMDLLLRRVKKEVIEMRYNVDIEWELDEDHSASFTELVLNRFARHRGTMTEHNKPNQSRAARELLSDYVDGKLLYVHPPPKLPGGEEEEEEVGDATAEAESSDKPGSDSENDTEEDSDEGLDDAAALNADESDAEEDEEEEEEEEELALPSDHPPMPVVDARDEQFNRENVNMDELYAKMLEKKRRRKKKSRAAYQAVERVAMEDLVTVEADGTHVVNLDLEDGIVQIDVPVRQRAEKQPTKRVLRHQQKRVEKSMNTRLLAVRGYAQVVAQSHTHVA
eukprot:GGOE01023726.1.p1 GENE.GGOE01023726.1~~GGOE01023726.1.p1  ORF type:complete len:727 (+),score=275.56 GGOE01023726.1:36-2216(+)